MISVGQLWDEYRAKMVPVEAARIQIVETRRAFYGGMAAFLRLSAEVAATALDDDEAVRLLADIRVDINAYIGSIGTPEERMLPPAVGSLPSSIVLTGDAIRKLSE